MYLDKTIVDIRDEDLCLDNNNPIKLIEITKEIIVKIERVLNCSISFSEEGEKVLELWSFQMCIKMRNYLGSMKII